MTEITNPYPYFAEAGTNGYIYVGTANMDAQTNPVTVYRDEARTIPWAQPIRTLSGYPAYLGAKAAIFTAEESVSLTVKDINGVTVSSIAATTFTPVTPPTFLTPEDYGAVGDGLTDDTAALQDAFNASASTGKAVWMASASIYAFTQVTIPDGAVLTGTGAVLRTRTGLSGSSVSLIVGNNVKADTINISSPGTEANSGIMSIGDNVSIGTIIVTADSQRTGEGITSRGQDVRIGKLITRNVDRPIHFNNGGSDTPTTGMRLGYLDCESFVRGFRATNCDKWVLGDFTVRTRSPNGSYTAGHNGILITDCQDWQVGDGLIHQSGEHAIRLSGNTRNTMAGTIGRITVDSCGGCAFKVNPYSTIRIENIAVAGIYGIDVGDWTESGGGENKELIRISHANEVRIGEAFSDSRSETINSAYLLKLNNCSSITVDAIGGLANNAGIILDQFADVGGTFATGSISGTTMTITAVSSGTFAVDDYIYAGTAYCGQIASFGTGTGGVGTYILTKASTVASTTISGNPRTAGPVQGIRVHNYGNVLNSPNNAVVSDMDGQSIGDIYINFAGSRGWTTNLASFAGTSTVTGPIVFTGVVGGTVAPKMSNAQTDTFMNVFYRGTLYAEALALTDGITAPSTITGRAQEYVDTADGDLKVKFGDGVTKTIMTDT